MDYEDFKSEFKKYDDHDWEENKEWKEWEALDNKTFKNSEDWDFPNVNMYKQADLKDGKRWLRIVEGYDREQEWGDSIEDLIEKVKRGPLGPVDNDGSFYHPETQNDMVNSPSHYTRGTQEAIDIIEEAIQDAPDIKSGMLQAQALKYLLRLWLKGNAPQDASKAEWYLTRLIQHLKKTE